MATKNESAAPLPPPQGVMSELRALLAKATPGPWRWNVNETTKFVEVEGGRPTYDKTVMDFGRWGLNRGQPRFNGALVDGEDGFNIMYRLSERSDWLAAHEGRAHHRDWFANVVHPDAALIVAAVNALPGLLDEVEALRATRANLRAGIDGLYAERSALLARCEGLEAERNLAVREHQAFLTAARAAADSLPLPKLSPMKLDCYKAGARAMIVAINEAWQVALNPPRGGGEE